MADMADRILPLLSPGGPALPPDVVAVLTETREALREHEALLDRCARLQTGVAQLRDELRAELPELHPLARVLAVEVVKRVSARLDALL